MNPIWGPSTLWPVRPIGIGTARVESLASYLNRLAGAHVVPAPLLIREVFRNAQVDLEPGSIRAPYGRRGAMMVGGGRWAQEISGVFSQLTGQTLDRLTLLAWSRVLNPRTLIGPTRRWCPDCYQCMRTERSECWDPLVWSLAVVRVCPEHDRVLSERCPKCNRPQPWIGYDTPVGRCSVCGTDLAAVPSDPTAPVDRYEDWCARECSDLVQVGSTRSEPVKPAGLILSLNSLIDQLDGGNLTRFGLRVGASRVAVRKWRTNGSLSLDMLMAVCWSTGSRTAELLVEGLTGSNGSEGTGITDHPGSRDRRWVRRDWTTIESQFDRIVQQYPSA